MAIMPTRSFPPGAISDAGAVCPNATADKPASNAIERRIRLMCLSPERIVDRNMPTHNEEANSAIWEENRKVMFDQAGQHDFLFG
jgi:hypothetical protein